MHIGQGQKKVNQTSRNILKNNIKLILKHCRDAPELTTMHVKKASIDEK